MVPDQPISIDDALLATVHGGAAKKAAPQKKPAVTASRAKKFAPKKSDAVHGPPKPLPGDKLKKTNLTAFGRDKKISGRDVKQGKLGNGWLQANLAALADRKGGKAIRNLVKPQANGKYKVNLHSLAKNGKLVKTPVTVNAKLPYQKNGRLRGNQSDAAWPGIVEKAVAKKQGNNYAGSLRDGSSLKHGGSLKTAAEMTTGKRARNHAPKTLTAKVVTKDLKQGIATIGTARSPKDKRLTSQHAYQVKSADAKKKTVTLHDPFGKTKDVTVKESALRDPRNFRNYTEVDLEPSEPRFT